MPVTFPLTPAPVVVDQGGGASAPAPGAAESPFGRAGLLFPFRRDAANDFASGSGVELILGNARQILGTKCTSPGRPGELRWRSNFGSLVSLLRHRNNNPALAELARLHVVDALRRWEPRLRVTSVALERVPRGLNLRCRVDIVDPNAPGNRVLVADEQVNLFLPGGA